LGFIEVTLQYAAIEGTRATVRLAERKAVPAEG
jgi:hypothetical protein